MPEAAHADLLTRAEAIIDRSTACARQQHGLQVSIDWVMSVIDEEGYPAASMITAARAEGLRWIAFCTGTGWNKPRRIARDPRTCVYLFDEASFTGISLTGRTEVLTDPAAKRRMWYDELGDVFDGPDDARWCVLLFRPERYNIFIDGGTIRGQLDV